MPGAESTICHSEQHRELWRQQRGKCCAGWLGGDRVAGGELVVIDWLCLAGG